jgi:8-oxo-dGTP diphosphatase
MAGRPARPDPARPDAVARTARPAAGGAVGGAVDVDVAVALLTLRQGRLAVLAVPPAADDPGAAAWHLPAGSWGDSGAPDADALAAAVLDACTGAQPFFLEQLRTYTDRGPDRVTIAYVAVVPEETAISGPSRAFALDDVLGTGFLPAAHERVVDDAVERLRAKLEYTTVGTSLVSEPFTIPELRRVYEAVWGVPLHPANFRRKVLATPGFVSPLSPAGTADTDDRRGPDLYLRGTAALLHPAMLRPQ